LIHRRFPTKKFKTLGEEAYERFETQKEEIQKFIKRFKFVGQKDWKRDAQMVELFCGRCNGIRALEKLGFTNLEGVDISPNLLANYRGKAKLYQSDCRNLTFCGQKPRYDYFARRSASSSKISR
jgi:ubiquinone/menaquinone biosynthesis C-methylase UbiE